jgi:hypothetical protein
LACFNYVSANPKKKTEVNARKIFLQRSLFAVSTKEELDTEIHQYMQGNSTYSTSCFGGASGDVKSRIASAYNLGIFKSLQTDPTIPFENLPKKERKRLTLMIQTV